MCPESGIATPEDVETLRRNGTDAVLIGETLMRSLGQTILDAARPVNHGTGTKVKICGLSREQDIEAANQAKPDYMASSLPKAAAV